MIDGPIVGLIGFGLLLLLLALGVHVAVSMAVVGLAGFAYLSSVETMVPKLYAVPFGVVSDYGLATIPLFVLAAYIASSSGFVNSLFDLASRTLGPVPGGLAMATVVACAMFAAASASSMATALTLGLIAIPQMRRMKYEPELSSGCVAAGGTMGALIPPSAMAVLYGTITETSIGKLFMGGIIPGILEAVFYMVTIFLVCRFRPEKGPPTPPTTLKEKLEPLSKCGDILILIVFVLGGIFLGWFTPTEAGAAAAFGALVLSLVRKRLTWNSFKNACLDTLRTTGLMYFMVIGAFFLNPFVALSGLPTLLSEFVAGLPLPPLAIMAVILLIYIVLGCFLDAVAMVLITIPVFWPLVMDLGFHPVWFGIMLLRISEIAVITPPVGINLFVIGGLFPDLKLPTVFKGVIPFIIADICNVALLLFIPQLVLFLPGLMR